MTGPGDCATAALVGELRALQIDTADGELGVTGKIAVVIDVVDSLDGVFPSRITIIIAMIDGPLTLRADD